jgi:hypothetical protein
VSNTFTFTAPCSYTASPTTQAMAAAGGVASVAVTTTSGCAWTATGSPTWITITGRGSGTGNGKVSYAVAANTLTSDWHADGGRPGRDHHATRSPRLRRLTHDSGDGGRWRGGERRGHDDKRSCVDGDRSPRLDHDREWGQRHSERHCELHGGGEYADL